MADQDRERKALENVNSIFEMMRKLGNLHAGPINREFGISAHEKTHLLHILELYGSRARKALEEARG